MSNTNIGAWWGYLTPKTRTPLPSKAVGENLVSMAFICREVALQRLSIFLQCRVLQSLLERFSRLIPSGHDIRSSRSGFLWDLADHKHQCGRTSQKSPDNLTQHQLTVREKECRLETKILWFVWQEASLSVSLEGVSVTEGLAFRVERLALCRWLNSCSETIQYNG